MKNILQDRILVSISIAVIFLWFVPDLGKKIFPNVFDQIYVQWPSIILLSVFIALGLVRSGKIYFTGTYSKTVASGYFFSFISLILYLLVTWSVGLVGMVKSYHAIQQTTQKEIEVILANIKNVRLHPNAETRFNNAYIFYAFTGVAVFYLDEHEKPVLYQPDEKSKLQYSEFKKVSKEKKEILNKFYSLIKSFEFCFIAFFSSLITTLTISIAFLFRKEKMK